MGTEKRERQKARRQERLAAERAEQQVVKRKASIRRWIILGAIIVAAVVVIWFFQRDGGDDTPEPDATAAAVVFPEPGETSDEVECPADDGSSPRVTTFVGTWADAVLPICIDLEAEYEAIITTTEGDIRVQLDTNAQPEATNAFITLARYGYYDGAPVFRTNRTQGFLRAGLPPAGGFAPLPFEVPADEGAADPENGIMVFAADENGIQDGSIDILTENGTEYTANGVLLGTLDADSEAVATRILSNHEDGTTINDQATGSGAPSPAVNIESVEIVES